MECVWSLDFIFEKLLLEEWEKNPVLKLDPKFMHIKFASYYARGSLGFTEHVFYSKTVGFLKDFTQKCQWSSFPLKISFIAVVTVQLQLIFKEKNNRWISNCIKKVLDNLYGKRTGSSQKEMKMLTLCQFLPSLFTVSYTLFHVKALGERVGLLAQKSNYLDKWRWQSLFLNKHE